MGNFILKYKYYIAFAIFLIHYFFKLYALGVNGLWYDECYSVNMGSNSVNEILRSTQTTDPNPPLYLIILHYWMYIFGDSEYAVRLLSVVASSMSGSALFLFCIRFLNWQSAIFASMMFFASNEMYYYGQEARNFSIEILFVILSHHFFLSIIKTPKFKYGIMLGLCNTIVFYLHLVGVFNMVAQAISFPLLVVTFNKADKMQRTEYFAWLTRIAKKPFYYYLVSVTVFACLLLPWKERIMGIFGTEGQGKSWWLSKPTFDDLKYCVYEICNSEEMYKLFIVSIICMIGYLIIFKKRREKSFELKTFLFLLISGPLLIYLIYLAAAVTPMFYKRYVLFTYIGFILLYAYTFSAIKINFYAKLLLFLGLSVLAFQKLVYPREAFWEYNKAMVFLKEVQAPDTYISTDVIDVFAYYYDKKIFHLRTDSLKRAALAKEGIFAYPTNEWAASPELNKYKHIYYTSSFSFYDPGKYAETTLRSRFIATNEIRCYKNVLIFHFLNPAYIEKKSR